MKPFTAIVAALLLIGMTAAADAQQPQPQPQQSDAYVVAGAPRPIYPAPVRAALGRLFAPRAYYQPQYLATPTPAVRLTPLPAAVRFCPHCRQYHP